MTTKISSFLRKQIREQLDELAKAEVEKAKRQTPMDSRMPDPTDKEEWDYKVRFMVPRDAINYLDDLTDDQYIMGLIRRYGTPPDIPDEYEDYIMETTIDLDYEEISMASSRHVHKVPVGYAITVDFGNPPEHVNCRSTPTEIEPVCQCHNCDTFVYEAAEEYVVLGDDGEEYCSITCLNEVYVG